jgi:hypothetical protein
MADLAFVLATVAAFAALAWLAGFIDRRSER